MEYNDEFIELPFGNTGHLFLDPRIHPDTHPCGVCETLMPVVRDQFGPTGWAEAMAEGGHSYDEYICPHKEEIWHQQAVALAMQIEASYSATLRELMLRELKQILADRKSTVNKISILDTP